MFFQDTGEPRMDGDRGFPPTLHLHLELAFCEVQVLDPQPVELRAPARVEQGHQEDVVLTLRGPPPLPRGRAEKANAGQEAPEPLEGVYRRVRKATPFWAATAVNCVPRHSFGKHEDSILALRRQIRRMGRSLALTILKDLVDLYEVEEGDPAEFELLGERTFRIKLVKVREG